MCNIGNSEPLELYKETTPTARKQHVCCECGANIEPGENYERIEGMMDGKCYTFKTCSFCAHIREKARDDFEIDYDEGFPFTELWECVGMDYAGAGG